MSKQSERKREMEEEERERSRNEHAEQLDKSESPRSAADGNWYAMTTEEALSRLEADGEGLSSQDAESRLERYGPNTIRTREKVSAWRVLLHQFKSPLIYVLLGALAVVLGLQFWGGGGHWGDVIVIAAVLVVNTTVGFIQEYKAETAVQALMQMVSPKARVRRDGQEQEIDADQIVPGDIVLVSEGDMVPADIRWLEVTSLQVNESALTGESVPVSKTADPLEDAESNLPPADQKNMGFMGTAVTSGSASGLVVATGQDSQLGEIARGVQEAEAVQSPLMRRMDRLAKQITAAILLLALLTVITGLSMGQRLEDMFLLAVALAVAAIPEGLPVVVTVALAVGVRRMANRHAVIRHLPAVETLGSTTVIISDKTGTLTQNRMTTRQIFAGDSLYEVTGKALSPDGDLVKGGEPLKFEENSPVYFTLLSGLLNNTAELDGGQENARGREEAAEQSEQEERQDHTSDGDEQFEPSGDPMEVALLVAAAKAGLRQDELLETYPKTGEVPFKTERRFSATIHDVPEGEGPLVLVKGAPEAILDMCANQMDDQGNTSELNRDAISGRSDELAGKGLRVLAMAVGWGKQAADSIKSESPGGMTFVGMQGLMDPPRPEAVDAVDKCHDSGIRVVMVTGDHARTAAAIAAKVHLGGAAGHDDEHGSESRSTEAPPEVHSGQEIADLTDAQLDELLERADVYSRVKPAQKLRIVQRLKEHGHIVAVTGDGVNDAPALKSAHLGAAMGRTGTDVAKEASDMVITDDNFASVYSAVEEGRTAFRNIRMATFFLLSTGVAFVILIMGGFAVNWPLPLLPAQLLWTNVVTNSIADVALGFEPGETALYRQPPRSPSEGILNRVLLERLIFIGLWLSAGTAAVFYWFLSAGDLYTARVAALTTLVLFQKFHVFNCRSEDVSIFKKSLFANKVLFIGVLTSMGVHIAALYIPWTQRLLSFKPLDWQTWLAIIPLAATVIIANELHKYFRPREKVERTWPDFRRLRPGFRKRELQAVDQRLDAVQHQLEENREMLEQLAQNQERAPQEPDGDKSNGNGQGRTSYGRQEERHQ